LETRALGRSNLQASAVGLGCNNFGMKLDWPQTQAVVHAALDSGITFFDTADMYGGGDSERFLGRALDKRRTDVVIATKFGVKLGDDPATSGGASRRYIMQAVEASLQRLNTDYIDLYQVHNFDHETPIEETLGALDDLVRQGKVRHIGHSNFPAWRIAQAALIARYSQQAPFITSQSRYSLLSRQIEAEVVPACQEYGLSILPYFPLESGMLTGKYDASKGPPDGTRWAAWANATSPFIAGMFSKEKFIQVQHYQALCDEFECSMLELAFGWLLAQPAVGSVIAGATTPDQIAANTAAGQWRPSAEQLAMLAPRKLDG